MSGVEHPSVPGALVGLSQRVAILERLPSDSVAVIPRGYAEIVAALDANFAYYKLNETSGDWADSSGGGRDLTFVSRSGLTRGVAGLVEEGDGVLAVECGVGDSPGTGHADVHIGALTDSFFRFPSLAAFSVLVTVKPYFTTYAGAGSGFSWGLLGTHQPSSPGWGISVLQPTNQVEFFRGTDAGTEDRLTSTSVTVQDTPVQLMFTFDGATYKIFFDGAHDSDLTPGSPYSINPVSSSATLRIGVIGVPEGIGGSWAPWQGLIDSLLIADVDLSDYAATLQAATAGSTIVGQPISGIDASGIAAGKVPIAQDPVTGEVMWDYPLEVYNG